MEYDSSQEKNVNGEFDELIYGKMGVMMKKMSSKERLELCRRINVLPANIFKDVVKFLVEAMPQLFQFFWNENPDEIELDICALDDELLLKIVNFLEQAPLPPTSDSTEYETMKQNGKDKKYSRKKAKREKIESKAVQNTQKLSNIQNEEIVNSPTPKKLTPLSAIIESILKKLIKKDKYDFFYEPVSTTVAPDYYQIIKNPMCFSTIKNKLQNGQYNNLKQFQDDVELICSNCTLYNAVNTIFYKAAVELLSYARQLITKNMDKVHPVEVGPISIHSEDTKIAEPTNSLQHSPSTPPTQRNSGDKNGANTRRSLKVKDSLKGSPSCIGKRVLVYWDEYDKKYPGTIVQFNRRRPAPYQVAYDDGDVEWELLEDITFCDDEDDMDMNDEFVSNDEEFKSSKKQRVDEMEYSSFSEEDKTKDNNNYDADANESIYSPHRKDNNNKRKRTSVLMPSTRAVDPNWSNARKSAWKKRLTNPNSYYYRFKDPGEVQKHGPWTAEEERIFFERLEEIGSVSENNQWGLFSMKIPGRVGYQCASFYRKMVKEGKIEDNNYYIDKDGSLKWRRNRDSTTNNSKKRKRSKLVGQGDEERDGNNGEDDKEQSNGIVNSYSKNDSSSMKEARIYSVNEVEVDGTICDEGKSDDKQHDTHGEEKEHDTHGEEKEHAPNGEDNEHAPNGEDKDIAEPSQNENTTMNNSTIDNSVNNSENTNTADNSSAMDATDNLLMDSSKIDTSAMDSSTIDNSASVAIENLTNSTIETSTNTTNALATTDNSMNTMNSSTDSPDTNSSKRKRLSFTARRLAKKMKQLQ